MEAIAIEIIIAVVSTLIGIGASEAQLQGSESRQARETFVRQLYQAIKNRFGLTINQLDQVSEKLGFKLSQLAETSRGSARLAKATKIYRDFIQNYPDMIKKINDTKNIITNEINNLEAKENAAAAKIENRQTVTNKDVLGDIVSSTKTVNDAISGSGNQTSQIDTNLIEEKIKNDKTDTSNIDTSLTESQKEAIRRSNMYGDSRRSVPKSPRDPSYYGISKGNN